MAEQNFISVCFWSAMWHLLTHQSHLRCLQSYRKATDGMETCYSHPMDIFFSISVSIPLCHLQLDGPAIANHMARTIQQ
jgi:hypothetical protein